MTGRPGAQGASVVELMASMLLISMLALTLHQFARALCYGIRVLEVASEAQEAARIGVHVMVRDLRAAGFSPDGRLGNGIRLAAADTVEVVSDLNGDGDSDDANEAVGYSFDRASHTLRRRMGAAPPQPLLSDLAEDGLELSFLDVAGVPLAVTSSAAATLAQIRRIDITLRVAILHPDPTYTEPLRATQTASVALRNG
jgi:type II secretory pathway component PulJ